MYVQVIYGLPSVGSGVDHKAKTSLEFFVFCHCPRCLKQSPEFAYIFKFGNIGYVRAGYEKNVRRGLGVYIPYRQVMVFFQDHLSGDFFMDYLAEYAGRRCRRISFHV